MVYVIKFESSIHKIWVWSFINIRRHIVTNILYMY